MPDFQNIPAFKFSLLFITGILIGSSYLFNMITLLVIIFILIFFIFALNRKQLPQYLFFISSSFLIILFGILKSNIDFFINPENSIREFPDTQKKSTIELIGIINDIPDFDSSHIRFLLISDKIISRNDTFPVKGYVMVTVRKDIYSKMNIPQPVLEAGDNVSLTGKLSEAPSQRNPGEFDYKKYLEIQNITKIFLVSGYDNVRIISKNNLSFFYQDLLFPSKIFALNSIDKNFTGDESAYLKGLVTGERSNITSEMKDAFINAGVMHLIAVSGLNVAYIIISLTLILLLFRIQLFTRTIIVIIFLIFYCMFTGSPASIVRATIMGILVLLAILLERRINFYNIIGTAAMIILINDSKQLFDAGFILSFSATLSMALIYSVFERTIINKFREWNLIGKKLSLWITVLFFTSLAAQAGTLPVTALYFGKISLVSVFANIIAVPLANLSLAIGFFQISMAVFSDYISSVISETNNILLIAQIEFIKWCASLKYSYIEISSFNIIDLICYYLVLTILLTTKYLREIFFRIVLCILIISCSVIYNYDFSNNLKVTFLDVGQGDCALVETPDNKTILIDCGTLTFTYNSGERTIAPYLKRKGINKIDLLIITHLHNDHIGGINFLLSNFKIGKIIESGQKFETPFTNTMDSLILHKNIPGEIVRNGDMIDDLNNLRLYFVFPTDDFVNETGYTLNNNLNNGSVAFILKYKNVNIFFGGDIEKEGERFLYDTYSGFLKTDILKVAHHGSYTSTTIPFIIKNKPDYAVISCGMYNRFNHPSDIVLNRLEGLGIKTFRTDMEGAVIFESDGEKIEKVKWK